MPQLSDLALQQKGLHVLFRELGEVDTMRFLSQINHESSCYIKRQKQLFTGMSIDDIYDKAKNFTEQKQGCQCNQDT